MTSETADWIVRISHDGVVTFADHLTPEEGAERAWGLLLQIAEQHGSNLERALTAKDARIAELESIIRRNWKGDYWSGVTNEQAEEINAALSREGE